jgi:hypothetical protein
VVITPTIHVDLTEVDRGLAAFNAAARNMGPAYKELRKPLRADQRQHARDKAGPGGAWPAKSPLTIARERRKKRRASRRGRVRKLLGRLPTVINMLADRKRVAAISGVRWSDAQQHRTRVGKGAMLQPRVFLWASPAMLKLARKVMADHLTSAWIRSRP